MFAVAVPAWLPHCSPRAVCPWSPFAHGPTEPQAPASLRGRQAAVGFVFVLPAEAEPLLKHSRSFPLPFWRALPSCPWLIGPLSCCCSSDQFVGQLLVCRAICK